MIEQILTGTLLVGILLLLSLAPLALIWLLYREGIISREEAEQAVQRMADGQVWL